MKEGWEGKLRKIAKKRINKFIDWLFLELGLRKLEYGNNAHEQKTKSCLPVGA